MVPASHLELKQVADILFFAELQAWAFCRRGNGHRALPCLSTRDLQPVGDYRGWMSCCFSADISIT
jgi:hypothetical protein